MAIGGVVINFVAKTAAAVFDVDQLTKALQDVDRKAGKADTSTSSLGRNLKAGLAGAAAAVGTGLLAAGAALVDFGAEALADKKSADNLARTLKTIPGITDEMVTANDAWISSMQLATNISDTDLRNAVQKLALATGDLKTAQDLAALSTDAAAGSGKSYSKVSDAMAKAAAGNTSQLERMFPWLDKNKDGTLTLKEATDGLGKAYGGAAKAAADRSPWERLKTIWGEIKESLGTAVIPAVEEFGEWFKSKKNQKAVQDFIDGIAEAARQMGDELVPAIRDFLKWMGSEAARKDMSDFASDMRDLAGAVASLVSWLASAYGWAKKVYDWLKKFDDVTTGAIWGKFGFPGSGRATPTGNAVRSANVNPMTRAAGTIAAPVTTQAVTVIATEEQVYRAVSRLVMRGDARNGRTVMAVP